MTRGPAIAIAIAASIGAGVIHLALGPEHLEELGALGWGFYLAAALQLGWVVAVLAVLAGVAARRAPAPRTRRVRGVALAGITMNVAILGAWVVSRTIGLPAGETPWVPEPIGRADLISAALEIGIVAIVALQLRPAVGSRLGGAVPRRGPARLAAVLSTAVIVAGTVVGLVPDGAHAAPHEETSSAHVHMLEDATQPTP
jgi:hypothetical protein